MYNKGSVLISKTVNVYDIYDRDDLDEIRLAAENDDDVSNIELRFS